MEIKADILRLIKEGDLDNIKLKEALDELQLHEPHKLQLTFDEVHESLNHKTLTPGAKFKRLEKLHNTVFTLQKLNTYRAHTDGILHSLFNADYWRVRRCIREELKWIQKEQEINLPQAIEERHQAARDVRIWVDHALADAEPEAVLNEHQIDVLSTHINTLYENGHLTTFPNQMDLDKGIARLRNDRWGVASRLITIICLLDHVFCQAVPRKLSRELRTLARKLEAKIPPADCLDSILNDQRAPLAFPFDLERFEADLDRAIQAASRDRQRLRELARATRRILDQQTHAHIGLERKLALIGSMINDIFEHIDRPADEVKRIMELLLSGQGYHEIVPLMNWCRKQLLEKAQPGNGGVENRVFQHGVKERCEELERHPRILDIPDPDAEFRLERVRLSPEEEERFLKAVGATYLRTLESSDDLHLNFFLAVCAKGGFDPLQVIALAVLQRVFMRDYPYIPDTDDRPEDEQSNHQELVKRSLDVIRDCRPELFRYLRARPEVTAPPIPPRRSRVNQAGYDLDDNFQYNPYA